MWRENLRRLIDERAEGNMKAVSKRAGLGPTAVRDILTKKVKSPSVETMEKIMQVLRVPWGAVFNGVVEAPAPVHASVAGQVAAGVWFEVEPFDDSPFDPVPNVPGRYPGVAQRAWLVRGPSMNRVGINDGDFVITVDYWAVRSTYQDGDTVVVERSRDGGLRERTVKEIEIGPSAVILWPRSTDERFREPIVVPRSRTSEHEEVELIGLVIGVFRPFSRR